MTSPGSSHNPRPSSCLTDELWKLEQHGLKMDHRFHPRFDSKRSNPVRPLSTPGRRERPAAAKAVLAPLPVAELGGAGG